MQNQSNAHLARTVIIGHLFSGAVASGLLIFHERFTAALAASAWYVLSIGLIVGMCRMFQWCRVLLAVWFAAGAAAAFVYLAWQPPPPVEPGLQPTLSVKLMPFWLSTLALGYLASGFILVISSRIFRATEKGFTLLETPRNW